MSLSDKIKKIIKEYGLFKTANLFGGIEYLKKVLSNDPEFSNIFDNLNGKVYYPLLDDVYEFDFEIFDYQLNRWETSGTAIINVLYDEKELDSLENEKLKLFIVKNDDNVDFNFLLNPEFRSFFPLHTPLVSVGKINGEKIDQDEILKKNRLSNEPEFNETEIYNILSKINSKNKKGSVNENKNDNSKLKNYLLNIIETQGLVVATKYVDGIENLSNIFNIPSTEMITDYFQERKLDIRDFNINTGGYEFIFKLLYVQNNDNYLLFFYEIVEGTVTLMMTDETLDLKSKKLKDFEFAWEIHQEINDLLNEFTYNLMRNLKLTGFDDVLIDYTI